MKNFQFKDSKESNQLTSTRDVVKEVRRVLLILLFTTFLFSCDNETVEKSSPSELNFQQNKTGDSQRYMSYGIIVRNWGSHNIDCSAPNGFCYDVWTISWRDLLSPQPTGTPVLIANENEKFVMKIQKSALTDENRRTLLRNGSYLIPDGQTIAPQIARSFGFHSEILVPGEYRIVESREAYSIAIDVN